MWLTGRSSCSLISNAVCLSSRDIFASTRFDVIADAAGWQMLMYRLHQPYRPVQQAESSELTILCRSANRANRRELTIQFVLPEMIAHAFLTLCFLLSGQWLAFLLNAPLVGYNVNK